MKRSICLQCGKPYVQYGKEHTCPACDGLLDELDEQVQRELDDPATKERIEAAIKRTKPT